MKRNILCLCVLLLLLPACCRADEYLSPRVYPLPIGEMKYILINWLERSGMEVRADEPGPDRVDLILRPNGGTRNIHLVSDTALATAVSISGEINDRGVLKFEETLLAFLNAYTAPEEENIENQRSATPIIPKVIRARAGAVVCINSLSNGVGSQFSGFVIDGRGTILCTAHDLKKYKQIRITSGSGQNYPGKVIKLDAANDMALIQGRIFSDTALSISNSKERLCVKEPVYAVGCPMNQLGKITPGSVSKPPVKAAQQHYWQVAMETSPGSSGSPVFDQNGALVGMVKGRMRGTNTIGFIIPVERIKAFVNEP